MTGAGFLRAGVRGATTESFPLFRCPGCGRTGEIDEDQFHECVSIQCECGWHETINWSAREKTP